MNKENCIEINNVSKKFCKSTVHSLKYGIKDIYNDFVGKPLNSGKLRDKEFWALKDINLNIKKNEVIGIIGANGSGKTTILKMLNNIFLPDTGRIDIQGNTGALIEVGVGFHPQLTGKENIEINASILGLKKNEIKKKFNDIVEFSGIKDFIDVPVKHYSSGMYVRLGFSIAVHCNTEILLIDEILAVGDTLFQIKCLKKMKELKQNGKTIIIVTHDLNTIINFTERVILIDKGKIICDGNPNYVVNKYLELLHCKNSYNNMKLSHKNNIFENINFSNNKETGISKNDLCKSKPNYNPEEFRYGNGKAEITDFEMLNKNFQSVTAVKSRDILIYRIKIKFNENTKKPVVGLTVKTKDGKEVYGTNTVYENIVIIPDKINKFLTVDFKLNLSLQSGDYFFSCGIIDNADTEIVVLDRRYDLSYITVLPIDKSFGIAKLDCEIKLDYKENNNE